MLTSIRKTHSLRQAARSKKEALPTDRFCRPEITHPYPHCWKCQVSMKKDAKKNDHREMCSTKTPGRLTMPAKHDNMLKLPHPGLITPYHYYGVFDSEAVCRPRKGNYILKLSLLSII
jgi:hypothetical protein